MEIEEDTTVENSGPEIKDPKAVLEALENAKKEAKKFREERDALREELNRGEVWKERAIRAEVRENLREQGIKNPDRILKYISIKDIQITDAGDLEGLEDQIETVKNDLPELFDVKRQVGGKADLFADNPANEKPRSSAEILAERLAGAQ